MNISNQIRQAIAASQMTPYEAMRIVNALQVYTTELSEGYQQNRAKIAAYELAFALMMMDMQQGNPLDTEHGEHMVTEWEQDFSQQYLEATKGL